MTGHFRKIVPLALVLAAGVTMPAPADAAPCTSSYQRCLNDSYSMKGIAEYMANLECGAGYAGCIMLIFMI